ISSSGDAFPSDEEKQLTRPGPAEACKQSLLRHRVLNEVDVSIEMEPKWVGPDLSHGYDGRQVSWLAAPDQCHGGAATRGFRHAQLGLRRWNDFEASWLVFVV